MVRRLSKYVNSYKGHNWSEIGNGRKYSLILDCLLSRVIDGTHTEQYLTMEFYRKNHRERKEYLTNRRVRKFNNRLLAETSKEERDSIGNKYLFNKKYSKWVKRGFISTEEATREDVLAFIQEHQTVLVKPVGKWQGKGIYKLNYNPETINASLDDLMKDRFVLEELIVQHPKMSQINPSSVNSLRVVTVLDMNHKAHIVNVELRGGGKNSVVDNYHAGGACYPVDIEEGVVFMKGRGNVGAKTFLRHPASGLMMLGFQIPNWDIMKASVIEAAEMSENLRYLGWDVAITPEGIELIEANYGHDAAEIDNVGKYRLVKELLGF